MTKKEFEKGYMLTYNSGSQYIKVGGGQSEQELKTGTWRQDHGRMLFTGLLSYPSDTTQSLFPQSRDVTPHNGLDPTASINNNKDAL